MTLRFTKNYFQIFWASITFVFLLSTLSGMPLVLYTHKTVFSYISLFLSAFITFLLWGKLKFLAPKGGREESAVWINPRLKNIAACSFLFLILLGALILYFTNPQKHFLSPWIVIPPVYVYIFFFSSFIIWFLAFSKISNKLFLLLAIFFLFLQHSYLPLIYKNGFGGDRLRHLAIERSLKQGKVYSPALFGENIRYASIGPLKVPEVFLVGNKTSYAPQWGLTLLVNEITGLDLVIIDKWLVPILWAVFVPILVYLLAVKIFPSPVYGRVAVLATAVFYPLQAFGATTVPVSFYFPFFLGACYLWLKYLRGDFLIPSSFALFMSSGLRGAFGASLARLASRKAKQFALLVCPTFLFFFGYALYFFLLILISGLAIVKKIFNKGIIFYSLAAASLAYLPFLEIWQDGSVFSPHTIYDFLINIPAEIFGRVTGLVAYFASAGYLDQGNFIFNHTGRPLIALPILAWRVFPVIISSGILFLILLSARKLKTVSLFLFILLANYFFSWYLLSGSHILARRLDEAIALLFSLLLAFTIFSFFLRPSRISNLKKAVLISFLFSGATILTYTSGPVLDMVTEDEFLQAKVVWARENKIRPPYCVIANTWPLLALEYESSSQIIGGGFPLYKEYAQPERVKIFELLSKRPYPLYFKWAKRITGAKKCVYATESRFLNDRVLKQTMDLLGDPKKIGETYIWEF